MVVQSVSKEIQQSLIKLKEALRFKGNAVAYANNMMDVVRVVVKQLQDIIGKKNNDC